MRRRHVGRSILVAILAAVSLTACSTMDLSSFGSARSTAKIADLPDIGGYTADRALAEARAHFRNNDFGYSAALYKRVVELSPRNPEGYVGLGASYDHLGRFDLSDRVYASLFALSGGTAQYYNNVGYSQMLRGNLVAALTNLRKARKLDPGNIIIADNLQILANAAATGPV